MSISLEDALRQIDTNTNSQYLPIPIGEDQETQELAFQSFIKDYGASYPPGATSNYFVSSGNIENTGALSFIKTVMLSLMYHLSPDDLKFLIIDSSNDFLEFAETKYLFKPIAKNLTTAKEFYTLYEEERKRRFDIVIEQREGLNSIYPLIQSKKVTDAPLLVLIDNDFDINYADSPNLLQNFYTRHFVRNDGYREGSKLQMKNLLKDMALGTGVGIRYDLEFFVLRLDWGIGIHVPYKSGFYNMNSFKDSQSLHFAIGYPF